MIIIDDLIRTMNVLMYYPILCLVGVTEYIYIYDGEFTEKKRVEFEIKELYCTIRTVINEKVAFLTFSFILYFICIINFM